MPLPFQVVFVIDFEYVKEVYIWSFYKEIEL